MYTFDVSKHEVGRTTSDPSCSTPRGGLTQSCPILGLYLSSQGPWEVVEGIFIQNFTLICEFVALFARIYLYIIYKYIYIRVDQRFDAL